MSETNNHSNYLDLLSQKVSDLETTQDFIGVVRDLKAEREAGRLAETNFYELAASAFSQLPDLEMDSAEDRAPALIEEVLSVCVQDHAEARIPLSRCRDFLRIWLDELPAKVQERARGRAVSELAAALEAGGDARAVCWTLSHIGYGSSDARSLLWSIIQEHEADAGDAALSVLTGLGIPENEREETKNEIRSRAEVRYSRSLVTAIGNTADLDLCLMMIRDWIGVAGKDDHIETSIIVSALGRALDARCEDHDLQDAVWQELSAIVEAEPEKYLHTIALGKIATNCNSAKVVQSLLSWIARTESGEEGAWSRYLLGLRLEECIRPQQLLGWKEVSPEKVVGRLVDDAVPDTGLDVLAPTKEFYTKEMAWKTLLRGGTRPDEHLLESIGEESHKFLQQRLLDLVASLGIGRLPGFIRDLVTERVDLQDEDPSSELARRISAQRVAKSTGTWSGFELLLRFGMTYDGKVLRQTTNALGELAIHLARENPSRVVTRLLSGMSMEAEEHHRIASSAAIEQVATRYGDYIDGHADVLINYCQEEAREDYERAAILGALGRSTKWRPEGAFLQKLESWAQVPDRWVGGASLELLGRKGALAEADNLLKDSIGLRQRGDRWELAAEGVDNEWQGFFVGMLYDRDPERFLPALTGVLSAGELGDVLQASVWLRKHYGDTREPPSQKLIDTILQRISASQSRYFAETDLFELVGDLAFSALVDEPWENRWEEWLPDARVALVETLRKSHARSNEESRVANLLQRLAADGNYAVRRAAYRALSEGYPDRLRALAASWMDAKSLEMKKRAAEARGWLAGYFAQVDEGSKGNEHDALADMSAHPEPEVRASLKQGIDEGRRQAWSGKYRDEVAGAVGSAAKDSLAARPYGDALGAIGDDSTIDELRSIAADVNIAPHLKHWVGEIVGSARKSWRKRTKEWPEPWFAWSGEVATGSGTVILGGKSFSETNYSIWKRPAEKPQAVREWGGAFWPAPFVGKMTSQGKLILDDGSSGRFVLNDIRRDIATFTGTGAYPHRRRK